LGDYVIVPVSVGASAHGSTRLTTSGLEQTRADERARVFKEFGRQASRPIGLQLFSLGTPEWVDFQVEPGDTVEVQVRFRVEAADLSKLAPLVDEYGQCTYADWPEKVRSDGDLRRSLEAERRWLADNPRPDHFDKFGGYTRAWRAEATGCYRVEKRQGYWWLITPEGHPCFYLGVCSAPGLSWPATPVSGREFIFKWLPPREGVWASAWGRNAWDPSEDTDYVSFIATNLIRKFGEKDWVENGLDLTKRRLAAWGFSGVGKWGGIVGLPYLPVLSRAGVPGLAGHADVFDPAVRAAFEYSLRKQIEPRVKDPWVVGWSVGNEWDETIKLSEIQEILRSKDAPPAKRALIDYALDTLYGGDSARLGSAWGIASRDRGAARPAVPAPSVSPLASTRPEPRLALGGASRRRPENLDRDALYYSQATPTPQDAERLRQFYADRYYDFIYRTVKRIDPNHLYLGFWITPDWALEPWDADAYWRIAARYCDVIGYDRYALQFAEERWLARLASTDKPVLCGEFSFPPTYAGMRAFGVYGVHVRDEAEAGRRYREWVKEAAENPYCVGLSWFEYRDQPITGRGPGRGEAVHYGEHYAFGLTDMTDRPKYALVERIRRANLCAPLWRLAAAAAHR